MLNQIDRKKNPAASGGPPGNDLWTIRMVVGTLSVTLVSCVTGAVWLQVQGKPTPELLTTLGTGSFAALVVVLRPSHKD
jgi:hypothetical protein